MEVIKKRVIGEKQCQCGVTLRYDMSDIKYGAYGCPYITCPVCGQDIYLDDVDGKTVNYETFIYPDNFHYCYSGVTISDETIMEWIKEGIDFLRRNVHEYVWITQSGNTAVIVFNIKRDENYYVIVTNNYKDGHIEYTDKDIS